MMFGEVEGYNILSPQYGVETDSGSTPLLFLNYTEKMSPGVVAMNSQGKILKFDKDPWVDDVKWLEEGCLLCEMRVQEMSSPVWAQYCPTKSIHEDNKWFALRNTCAPFCADCAESLEMLASHIIKTHSDKFVSTRI